MAFVCGTKQHKLNLSDYRDESRIDTISSAEAILKSVDIAFSKTVWPKRYIFWKIHFSKLLENVMAET